LAVNYTKPQQGEIDVMVFDLQGRRLEKSLQQFSVKGDGLLVFNTTHWSDGSYIIRVKSGEEITQAIARHVK